MALEDKDINELKKELESLAKSVSSIGDSVRLGVREGMKDGNSDIAKKNKMENDSELADKTQARLVLRQKEEYERNREMVKTNVKSPEQQAQEKAANAQFKTNEYLDQLTKLIKENNETLDKKTKTQSPTGDAIGDVEKKKKPSSTNAQSSGMKGEELVGNLFKGISDTIGGIKEFPVNVKRKVEGAADWMHGIGSGEGIKSKISGGVDWVKDVAGGRQASTDRQKQLEETKKEINKEKMLLSAEEAELEKLKKQRGKNRDAKAIDELKTAVQTRKDTISTKSDYLGSIASEEYLYQKGKQDKDYKLKGREKELVLKQMHDNISSSITSDIDPVKTSRRKVQTSDTSDVSSIGSIASKISGSSVDSKQMLTEFKKLEKSLTAIEKNTFQMLNASLNGGLSSSLMDKKPNSVLTADTKLSRNPTPTTLGEYISGIYSELKQSNELNKSKPKLEEVSGESGGGIMDVLGKMLPALGGLAPMMSSIAGALPAIAVAAGGAYLLKKTYDMTEQTTEGTTVGDVGAGIQGWISGKGFTQSLEDRQLDRVQKIHKKEGDATQVAGYKTQFENLIKPKLQPYAKYITNDQMSELEDSYIQSGLGNITHAEFNIARNRLIKSAKSIEEQDTQATEEYKTLTGEKPKVETPSKSDKGEGARSNVTTQTSMTSMGASSGMDQLTAMTIQAKLIAMEMLNMQKNPDYVNQQKSYMKENGKQFANALVGGD